MVLPAFPAPQSGLSSKMTTEIPRPWPDLNTLIKTETYQKLAMKLTAYRPILPDELKEPTVNVFEELWFRLGPYSKIRPIGNPPETIIEGK